ncbi:MAG: hypothetical protein HamCj_07430 [Candidatus Hamiltonella defensa (Ceratovacuna japonica)]
MPRINKMFSNTEKLTTQEELKIHYKFLKNQKSNIANKLINANNISDLKFNFLLKKFNVVQQKQIRLIDNRIKLLQKDLADLKNPLKTTTSETEIKNTESIINILEKKRKKISDEKTLKLKRAADIKRENLEARHPGKIHYDEPITPFIPMTYDKALKILDENTWINRNHQKTQSTETKEKMKSAFDVLETCDAEQLIKQPSQSKGKLRSVLRYSQKTLSGCCWGHMIEGIIQKSQGKNLDSSMRFGNQIKASSLNKIIKNQMEHEKQYEKILKQYTKTFSKYQSLKLDYDKGMTQHVSELNVLAEKINKLAEKIRSAATGEIYLTKHDFIKIAQNTRELENKKDKKAVETFVSSFIGDMTANKEQHQKVYKTIALNNKKGFAHAVSIFLEKQGKTETFTFSDPNYNRLVCIDDKQKFENFLRKNFSEKYFMKLKEVIVTDFIYKLDEQS